MWKTLSTFAVTEINERTTSFRTSDVWIDFACVHLAHSCSCNH